MIAPARFPPPVQPGDRVGIAALSGPIDPERLERGVANLVRLGFEPVLATNLASRQGYLAGSDDERLTAFHALAADPSLRAIVFARGGYGVLRLLARLDWSLLARHPRAYVGFSDLTPFLLEVVRRLGLVSFHGAMAAADLARGQGPEEEATFLDALAGRGPLVYPLAASEAGTGVEGALLGGCLSLLAATVGTPFAPALDGALLLVEDVNERLYRLDRMLTQLLLAGSLGGVRGVLVGHLDLARGEEEAALTALLADRLGELGVPVRCGLPCGHRAPNHTFPLGARARLEGLDRLVVEVS